MEVDLFVSPGLGAHGFTSQLTGTQGHTLGAQRYVPTFAIRQHFGAVVYRAWNPVVKISIRQDLALSRAGRGELRRPRDREDQWRMVGRTF